MGKTLASATRRLVTMRSAPGRWPLSHITPRVRVLIESPSMMRPYARAVLAEWEMGDRSEAAELIISELVTNVVRQATDDNGDPVYDADGNAPVFRLGLFSDRSVLLIEVFDTVPGAPERRYAGDGDESGRGLMIVGALSEEWGTRPCPGGKVVYARLGAP